MKLAGRARGSACRAERIQHLPPPARGSTSGRSWSKCFPHSWPTTALSSCGCIARVNVAVGAPAGAT